MTMNDSANLPDDGGSKTVDTSELDNSEALNFWEPEDEQANLGAGENEINNEAENAGNAGDEAGDTAGGDNENDENGNAENAGNADDAALDETVVTLKGGEQVPVKELKLGYMRERDYRLKTQDTANRARSLDEMSSRVANTAQAIANFLASQLPEEPSPQLAMTNPAAYTQQRALYETSMQRLNQIMQMGAVPRQIGQSLNAEQKQTLLADENARLLAAFPETGTAEGREKFFEGAFSTGRELGFSEKEMQEFTDHRYLKVIHYARLGLAAEAAKKTAMTKVNNAPVAVPKGKQQVNADVGRNKAAMERLARTGSLKDAMAIDF